MHEPLAAKFANPQSVKLDSYPLFDWLRFALASTVVIYHAKLIPWPLAGNFAVQVFFSLSGFLIGGILLRSEPTSLPRFFFNRATRIWIPYYVAVIAIYGLSILQESLTPRWLEFLFFDATFTHTWFSLSWPNPAAAVSQMPLAGTGNYLWSISVEEQFYLAAPLAIIFLPRGKSPILWGAVSAIFIASGVTAFASISLGVAAVIIGPETLRKAALVSGLAALALIGFFYSYFAPVLAVSIVLLCAPRGPRSRVGEFFGGVSYPLYLNHWMGVYVVNAITKRFYTVEPLVHQLLIVGTGLACGIIAYLLVDRLVLARRNAFYSDHAGRAFTIAAYGLIASGAVVGMTIVLMRLP